MLFLNFDNKPRVNIKDSQLFQDSLPIIQSKFKTNIFIIYELLYIKKSNRYKELKLEIYGYI